MEAKICTCCNIEKNITDFSKNLNKCKFCINEYNRNNYTQNKEKRRCNYKERYNKNKDNIIEKKKQYRKENKERLSTKHKPKEWKDKKSGYIKKYYQQNKDKILNQTKEYRKNNKENLKKYRDDNKDQIKQKNKIWRENNKDKIQEWRNTNRDKINEYSRNYSKRNPHIIAWRNLLNDTLKRMNTKKEKHTIEELGYSAEELKLNITNKFTNGMSWDNYGEWHIDHIKPVSLFDKGTPANIVCNLNNLQPLWATTREIDGIIYLGNINKHNYFLELHK
jgi:hypothetical protein